MPGLARDALEPRPDRWIAAQLEAALVRDVRVCVERDVGEGHAVADEPSAPVEVPLQRIERAIARSHPLVEPIRSLRAAGRSTRARTARPRSRAHGRTARRTSTGGPVRARTGRRARTASLRRSTR